MGHVTPSRSGSDVRPTAPTGDVLAPVGAALARVERERSELVVECRSFERFADRVADSEAVSPTSAAPPPANRRAPALDGDPLAVLRRAYRDTVLSVPHYDDAYDEPLAEHLAAEFGSDVAGALVGGGVTALTPPLKRALLRGAEAAVRDREQFVGVLDTERESLDHARESLAALSELLKTSGTVADTWPHDGDCPADPQEWAERVSTTRQRLLQTREVPARIDAHGLCEYLYDDEPFTYPVLSAVATLRDAM